MRYLAFCRFVQLGKTEFDEDLFVLGELHPLDEADQQLPALPGSFNEPLYQFPGPVLTADGAFLTQLQLLPFLLQLPPLQLDPAEDALEVRLWKQSAEPVSIHPVQVGGEAVDLGLERLELQL